VESLSNALMQVINSVQSNLPFLGKMLLLLWGLLLLNAMLGYRLNVFGIYPRHPAGLIGIAASPFLHGSTQHLFFNSIPLFVLAALILVKGQYYFFQVTIMITLLSGSLTWLLGRRAFHIGASGVIMGYWGFLLFEAFITRSVLAIVLAVLCLYYFAGLFTSIFPQEERTSWEGHLFGLVSGIAVAYLLAKGYIPLIFKNTGF
jgi:membrane associated rhomboid family serine protease